jgi:hypothetical protein
MAQRELYTSLNPGKVAVVPPIVGNNDTEGNVGGTGTDLAGYAGALIEYNFGISGDTLSGSVKVQATLEESDALASGYTAVDAADYVGTLPLIDDAAEDPAVHLVAYLGSKRYIRAAIDFTGTHTNGMPIAITIYRTHKRALNQ